MQIARPSLVGGEGEQRQEALLHLAAAAPCREGAEPWSGHEHLGLHPRAPPRLPVGVQDASAEKNVEDLGELVAFRIVGEVGREDVAHVGGVTGGEVPLAGDAFGFQVVARAGEEGGGPVVEVVEVGGQARELPDYWPFRRLQRACFLGLQQVAIGR
jgi:hypothetical protein